MLCDTDSWTERSCHVTCPLSSIPQLTLHWILVLGRFYRVVDEE